MIAEELIMTPPNYFRFVKTDTVVSDPYTQRYLDNFSSHVSWYSFQSGSSWTSRITDDFVDTTSDDWP